MKEVVEEITTVDKVTKFEAADGTRFDSKDECRKYETSALAVMRGRVMEYKVGEPKNAWTLMGGCDDNTVAGFNLPTKESVNVFLQWLYLECPWYLGDSCKERKEEVVNIVKKSQKDGDIILMGINCDGDYYFINSRNNIISNLLGLDKKEDEER